MKKVSALAIILLSIVLLPCYGQVNGVDFTTAIPYSSLPDDDNLLYERLIDGEEGIYIMVFKQTPVGYKHCLDWAKKILSDNGGDFSKDRIIDDSMYPPNIEGLTDYHNMPFELKISNAEIVLGWELTDKYILKVLCNDLIFSVLIIPHDGLNDQGASSFGNQGMGANAYGNQNLGRNAFGNQGVGETYGGKDITEGDGNQGDPKGTPDADNYGTGGGLGDGITVGGLGSRGEKGSLPKPNMSGCEITQKIEVKVEIVVDQDGKVESAIVESATYQDNCIWTMVVDAAKRSRFPEDRNANLKQTGWIKYTIVP